MQLDKLKDDISQLQLRQDEFDDTEQSSAGPCEQDMKTRDSKILFITLLIRF